MGSQGFVIDLAKKAAKADWAKGLCNNEVDVEWKTGEAGKLARVGGR